MIVLNARRAAAWSAAALLFAPALAAGPAVCLEPIEPYPYAIDKRAEPDFYADTLAEYRAWFVDVDAYMPCLADEQRSAMARSREILDRWIQNFGDDAALVLSAPGGTTAPGSTP